jgi:hypothetical protein
MAYCSKCGAEIPEGASFCPKCGAEVDAPKVNNSEDMGMDMGRHARRRMRREARWGRWEMYMSPEYRLMEAITGGIIVILLGVLLYLAASGITSLVTWSNFWAYLILGIGVILVLRFCAVLLMPNHGYYRYGNLIAGIIMIALGAAWLSISVFGWDRPFWPLIIVGGGILIIAVGVANFFTRRKVE